MVRHISFDLWLTLIKSHPRFKEERAIFLKKEFNPCGYSVKEIIGIVQNTDKVCDRLNEIRGGKIPTEVMYRRILERMGNEIKSVTDEVINQIKNRINELFMDFQPLFLNEFIAPMLENLYREGYTLNIGSNTGFIEGSTISRTLKNMGISHYFKFCIYSDQIEASKPSFRFFNKIYEKLNMEKESILHIGDNHKADYQGALEFGFKALHINNSQYTVDDIKRHL